MASIMVSGQTNRKTCNLCFKHVVGKPAKSTSQCTAVCQTCIIEVVETFASHVKEGGTFCAATDNGKEEGDFQPILCDTCDRNHFAAYHCRKCRCKLCFYCHNSHDTRQCSVTAVSASPSLDQSDQPAVSLQELRNKEKEQTTNLRKILDKHDEKLATLQGNMTELKQRIAEMYLEKSRIHAERSAVQSKYDALSQDLMLDKPSPADLKSILLTDVEITTIQRNATTEHFSCTYESESGDDNLSVAIASTDSASESGLEEFYEEAKTERNETQLALKMREIRNLLQRVSSLEAKLADKHTHLSCPELLDYQMKRPVSENSKGVQVSPAPTLVHNLRPWPIVPGHFMDRYNDNDNDNE